ncbi:MAG TPA: hypothetical protein VE685_02755 [Thermoanaerobaculia bacterium]|nr:hypothetical protein [Thermoanaerobaculia bacterium]
MVGGESKFSFQRLKEWEQYRKALVVRIRDGVPERVLEYESPPEHCPEGRPSRVFKAATFQGSTAYLCTEVLVCDLPDFSIRKVISLPCART